MWPFRRSRLLDEDTAAWHLANFAWLIEEFAGDGSFARSRLVLPRAADFPVDGESGHALAERLFAQVKAYCELDDWPVVLVADDDPLAAPREPSVIAVASQGHAAGRFMTDADGTVTITYVPALLARPHSLIATFAHELAHYLIATARTEPPCEADEHEFLTDLAAAYLGFGVFLANTRFEHTVVELGSVQGVGWSRTGYLPEADLVFALALYLSVKGEGPDAALPYLKAHLRPQLTRAIRQLAARPDVAALSASALAAQVGSTCA